MERKKLKDMTVGDVIALPEFKVKMAEVIGAEIENHRKAEEEAVVRKMRLKRTPYDHLYERGVLEADRMIELYKAVLGQSLIGFSASERSYIGLVGQQAFRRVVMKLKEEEEKEKKE